MTGGVDPDSGLARAARVFVERLRAAAPEPVAAFLARHAELREWLEPMLADGEPDPAPAADGNVGAAAVDASGDAGAAAGTAAAAGEHGARVGPFRLLRELGRGGMGVVHEARLGADPRPIALKVLHGHHALQSGRVDRFAREAELVRSLAHPGIVAELATGAAGDTPYLAMEFVVGAPLDAVLEQLGERAPATLTAVDLGAAVLARQHVPSGQPAPAHAVFAGSYVAAGVRIAIDLAEALAHLHAAGVVHRDVKPSNVLLCANGRVVLTDFGLARTVDGASLTRTGDFAGTPHYVSPEQAMAKRVAVDQRSDLFSLGSTLYELLTLRRAFPGDSAPEVLARILSKEPVPPSRLHPGLPADLATVLAKLLEKDPDRRYPDAAAAAADLRAFLDYRPVRAQRASTMTRLVRWSRREPLRAALVAVLAVTVPTLAAGAGYLWARADEIRAGRQQLRDVEVARLVDDAFAASILEDGARATAGFERALELDPHRAEAAIGLVLALLRRAGPEPALQALEHGLAPSMSPGAAGLLRFTLLRRLGRPEADALGERLPAPVGAFELCLAGLLDRDLGLNTGTTLVDSMERAVLASERPLLWLHLHWAAFADAAGAGAGAASARRCADSLLSAWPDAPIARHFACLALRRVDPERARVLVAAGLASAPDHGLSHWADANLREVLGDAPGALAALERTVARLPDVPSARYALGRLRFETGDLEGALVDLRRARELAPGFVEAWMGAGMALRRLGRVDEGLAALRRAVELHPTHADARFQLGQALVAANDLPAGLRELQSAVGLNGADANKWHHLAFARFAAGDDVGGEQALRRAVAAQPGLERAHHVLAMFLEERGTPAQLREALTAWVEALPRSADGWLQHGQLCLRHEAGAAPDVAGASWSARRVLALSAEQSAAGWFLLAEAEHAAGRSEPARTACERALAATPPLPPAAKVRCELLLRELPAPAAAAPVAPTAPADGTARR